jgi:hypothetical protein
MGKIGKLYLPDDKGYDSNQYKDYAWNQARKLAGLQPSEGADIQILGFYVKDTRRNMGICKNCEFSLVPDEEARRSGHEKPPLKEPPVFFSYAGEAASFIKKMNLSKEDESKIKIVALVPAPDSLGEAMPTHIFMDKDALKER